MSLSYTDAVYEYLAQPENYRAAKQIANQISALDEQLVHDFWTEVSQELQQRLENLGWQVGLSVSDSWLSVHRQGWESMGINFDTLRGTPDFGLHCSANVYDRTQVDTLLQEAGVRENEGMRRKTHEWPCYRALTGYNFWEPTTLERVLPAHRAAAVKEVADIVTDFVDKYGAILDRIAREAKLPVPTTAE